MRAAVTGRAAITGLALLLAQPAAATDLVLGAGYSSFNGANTKDSALLELELHSDPIWHLGRTEVSAAGALDVHRNGEYFLGAGVSALVPFRDKWFIEASVIPGYYNASDARNDLGSHFEIRSTLGLGRQITDQISVSVAVTHKSNAGTADSNPGVNVVALRTRWRF